eukprot:SAG31_NODE_12232_length_957_cov_1.099068_1_plen_77_part_00
MPAASETDLVEFFAKYVPDASEGEDTVFAFHGEPKKGGNGIEAELDIQVPMTLSLIVFCSLARLIMTVLLPGLLST